MRVVITRPAGDATAWVSALQAAGHTALSLPLIDVGPSTLTQPVADAWERWAEWDAVMFVSAQAVRYFFAQQPQGDLSHRATAGPTCWATGPGTHKALRHAGVPETCIVSPNANAVQFDSEALWQRVGANVVSGHKVLIVRGNDRDETAAQDHAQTGSGRDWLAQQIQTAGASAHFVVAYERRRPHWTSTQQALARHAAIDGSMWCFSSSQAIRHLGLTLPDTRWSQARCIATHDRIVEAAQSLGFGEVHLARPSVEDVLRSLESLT
jgi:uroporphyrinogen-III synthase